MPGSRHVKRRGATRPRRYAGDERPMYFIIAGCGRVGSRLAEYLSYEGHDVAVIDRDPGSFRRLGSAFNGIILEGMAFDEEVLLEAGIAEADAYAAVTDEDNTNLMAAEIARSVFEVPLVLSRLYNPEKELTYFKLGIDYVCGTTLVTDRIHEQLFQSRDSIVQQDRLDLGIKVVELSVGEEAAGKPAGSLSYGVSSKLLILLRDNMKLRFDEATPLEPGDRVVMLIRKEGWQKVIDCLGPGVDSPACRMYTIPAELADEAAAGPAPEESRVIVGGCSMVGAHLAYILSMEGHNVTIIDEDAALFKRVPPGYAGEFTEGVVYDEETLIAAGIERADAFVSVTKKDNKNLMAAEVARLVFGVPHVMARLFNPDKEPTYQALQMPFVCGTTVLSQTMLERLLKPVVSVRAACLFNRYNLVEFESPPSWDGKTVRQAVKDSGVTFAYIVRRRSAYVPEDNFVLRSGDDVTALVTTRRLTRLDKGLRKMTKG